jgi:6-phosphogluconolactonase
VTLAVEILPDAVGVARRAAEFVAEQARLAVARQGSFTMAVSGGRSPWAMFVELKEMTVAWDRVLTYQVDERVAPEGDPSRNLTNLVTCLPTAGRAGLRPMPVTDADLEAAAAAYARTLPPVFDLIHLGIGADGHTASLVPGDPVCEVVDRDIALTGVYQDRVRMTMTYPVLDRARVVMWLISGADKADAVRALRAADRSIPAGRVAQDHAVVFADRAAAGD